MKRELTAVVGIVLLLVTAYFTVGLPQTGQHMLSSRSGAAGSNEVLIKDPIRISSFNIRCICEETDPLDNWGNGREKRAATYLNDQSIDVVGIQEFERAHGSFLFGGRDNGYLGEEWTYFQSPYPLALNAIAWRSEKFTRLASGFAVLPFGLPSSDHSSSFSPRGLTWVQLYERDTRKRFYVFNTHLEYRGGGTDVKGESYETTRRRQVDQVLDTVRTVNTAGLPMVLMGDFNTNDTGAAYQRVTQSRLFADARALPTPGKVIVNDNLNTYHGYKLPVAGKPIDFIFVSPKSLVAKYEAVTDTYSGRYPSDHFPLFIDVELK